MISAGICAMIAKQYAEQILDKFIEEVSSGNYGDLRISGQNVKLFKEKYIQ